MNELIEHFSRIMRLHSTDGLQLLYEELKKALLEDDSLPTGQKKYGVREFADFRVEADAIEAEMKERGEIFEPIDWSTPSD